MRSLLRLRVVALASTALLAMPLSGQMGQSHVRLEISSGEFESSKPFTIKLKNDSNQPISFCMVVGHFDGSSGATGGVDPFVLQKWTGKRWGAELNGVDVGSGPVVNTMNSRESDDFQYQVNGPGLYRLQFFYSKSSADKCSDVLRHASHVNSKKFVVRDSSPPAR
jgi:hypothetical protein